MVSLYKVVSSVPTGLSVMLRPIEAEHDKKSAKCEADSHRKGSVNHFYYMGDLLNINYIIF